MTAVALCGSTFSVMPALKMVGATVVRMAALVMGDRANCLRTSGSKSQRLASASLLVQPISGPRYSNIWRVGPLSRDGNGSVSSFCSARPTMPIAVSAGGIELCPPAVSAVRLKTQIAFFGDADQRDGRGNPGQ